MCPTNSTCGANTAPARWRRPATTCAASRYFRETVRITVASDVANAYFRSAGRRRRARRIGRDARSRTDSVRLQHDRYDAGLIGQYDLKQSEAERSAVVADIALAKKSDWTAGVRTCDVDRALAARRSSSP